MNFPPIPPEVKSISHFLKVADEHDQRNVVISYWCRMYAIQYAMKVLPGEKPPQVSALLLAIMDWLEQTKTAHKDTEGIASETCAQAIIEEYAIKLLNYAESQDKNSNFDKNVVKAFYTSGILFDTLDQFGKLTDDIQEKRKYAKWRAAYIHNCLKSGETPTPGCTTVLYTEEDELMYRDFLPKEELDRIKGRIPQSPKNQDTENSFVPPTLPTDPISPTQPASSAYYPPAVPTQSPTQPDILETSPQAALPSVAFASTPSTDAASLPSTASANLSADQINKAQKYCKWASSALNYDDVATAVDNLQKALHLLQFGREM